MRGTLLFISFILFSNLLQGSAIPFSPVVWSYSVTDYNAGIQNWSIAQDERGIMYIGNNGGLLEYDGNNWRLHELPNRGIVRAVYISGGKIFVGSYEEFGYFERNSLNALIYHSLKDEVKDFRFHNDEIWSILSVEGEIVFHSFGSLFFYNGHSVVGVRMQALPLNILQVGNKYYSQQIDGGLSVFTNRERKELISRSLLGNSDVTAAVPYDKGALFLTRNSGGFIYQDGRISKWNTECSAELEKHTINRAVMTKDSTYIIGTISNGIYAVNKKGRLLWKENSDGRLLNNTVLGLYCDDDNNIWAALDEGIAYIQNNSLVYYFEPPHRKIGMVYDVLVKEDEAYVASNQGLYRMKQGQTELVSGLEEQAWFVQEWGDQVLCGHNKGTFVISGIQAKLICDVKGGMCLRKIDVKDEQSYLLEGSYGELGLYNINAQGHWGFDRTLKGFSHMIRNLEVDHQGHVWAEHLRKGLFRFKISPDMKRVENVKAYYQLGDVKDNRFALFKINGRVTFSNGEGFYTYEDMKDSIVPYKEMNEQLAELKRIHAVNHAYGNYYWFVNDRMAYLVKSEMNVFHIEHRIPFSLFKGMSMEERAKMVYNKRNNSSYLCLNNAIARIQADSSLLYKSSVKRSLWISQMEVSNDLSGSSELMPVRMGNKVKADKNIISFSLCYPVYNDYNYKIRYRLDGFSDHWVDGSRDMHKRYTRLPFGAYTFKAEVYNENGVLASTECSFEVMRPWYLSYWAIAAYVLLGMAFLFMLQYTVYQSVKKKKDRVIEQQRIAHQAAIELQEKKIIELEKEQLESDLKVKSKELSSVVMTNIAHQEFLNSLKEEIQQQKLSGQYTRKNLDKLLVLVNNNIVSDEENWNMFQANFDRIHENFFRNLKQQYPDLTSGDLRFCALLRLNLPTKEIAKLLNISIRGVDAARYRLRKKFGLAQEDSLTDFMINFK